MIRRSRGLFARARTAVRSARKILALYEIAEAEGYNAAAVDYRGIERSERARADAVGFLPQRLRATWCSWARASAPMSRWPPRRRCTPRGVFLMAPAMLHAGAAAAEARARCDCPMTLVHGWRDEIVPYEQSMEFAKAHGASLHLVESDHQLHSALPLIRNLFQYFLIELDLPNTARIAEVTVPMGRFIGRLLMPWVRFNRAAAGCRAAAGRRPMLQVCYVIERDSALDEAGAAARLRAREAAAARQAAGRRRRRSIGRRRCCRSRARWASGARGSTGARRSPAAAAARGDAPRSGLRRDCWCRWPSTGAARRSASPAPGCVCCCRRTGRWRAASAGCCQRAAQRPQHAGGVRTRRSAALAAVERRLDQSGVAAHRRAT